jgi:hypothetical protein
MWKVLKKQIMYNQNLKSDVFLDCQNHSFACGTGTEAALLWVEPECGSESPMAPAPYSSDSHQR